MSKVHIKTTFEASRTIRPVYTGGSTALDASGRLLATCVGEEALIVDLETGDQLVSLEGVSWNLYARSFCFLYLTLVSRMEN